MLIDDGCDVVSESKRLSGSERTCAYGHKQQGGKARKSPLHALSLLHRSRRDSSVRRLIATTERRRLGRIADRNGHDVARIDALRDGKFRKVARWKIGV